MVEFSFGGRVFVRILQRVYAPTTYHSIYEPLIMVPDPCLSVSALVQQFLHRSVLLSITRVALGDLGLIRLPNRRHLGVDGLDLDLGFVNVADCTVGLDYDLCISVRYESHSHSYTRM